MEHIVGNASLVVLRIAGKGFGGLQRGLVLLAVIGLEKTIQTYHINLVLDDLFAHLTLKLKNYCVNRNVTLFIDSTAGKK